MYLGRLVEQGTVRDVIRKPAHPYTRGLLAALPTLDDIDAPLTPIPGDIPSPLERPPGCVYNTRCQEVVGAALFGKGAGVFPGRYRARGGLPPV